MLIPKRKSLVGAGQIRCEESGTFSNKYLYMIEPAWGTWVSCSYGHTLLRVFHYPTSGCRQSGLYVVMNYTISFRLVSRKIHAGTSAPWTTVMIVTFWQCYCTRSRIACAGVTRIANFMRPTWGPPGSCRPQMGPMLVPWTLLSGKLCLWEVTSPARSLPVTGQLLYVLMWIRTLMAGETHRTGARPRMLKIVKKT